MTVPSVLVRNLALYLLMFLPSLTLASPLANTSIPSLGPDIEKQAKAKSGVKGAEILYAINESTLDEKGVWVRRSYYSIRINDQEAARDYGRITIGYNHYYSNTVLEFANVVSPSGALTPVSKDAVQLRVVGGGQDFYNDKSEIVFSPPNVVPGSTIEFQYSQTTKRRAITTVSSDSVGPHWFQRKVGYDGWRADPVRQFNYILSTPENLHFNIRQYGGFDKKPSEKILAGQKVRKWQWQKVPAAYLEPYMLPFYQVIPAIRVSTSTDWALVDEWTWEKVENKLAPTRTLQKIVSSFNLPKNATREQKIKRVYQYMQENIRYVFAHLGRGGYEPHYPDEAIKNGYGDCKDQSVLTVALLKILGVEAYPVLIETPNGGNTDPELVRLIFDHMMVWVAPTDNAPALWLDTTADHALFPGLSNYLIGQNALIVNGKGGVLKRVDADVEENKATLDLVYHESKNGGTVVNAVYTVKGLYEQHLRQWWKRDTNRDTSIKQFLGGIFENRGQYEVSSKVLNTENLFKHCRVEAEFVFPPKEDDDEPPVYGTSFGQIYSLVSDFSSMQVPESRKTVFFDPQVTTFEVNSHFRGNTDVVPALLSDSKSIETPFFSLKQSGESNGSDFDIKIAYTKPALKLSLKQYQDYYNELLKFNKLGGWVVSMTTDPSQEKADAAQKLQNKYGKQSFEYQLKLAQNYIEAGEFNKALESAEEAVRLAPENGEAWFTLGTAQGFSSLIEQSTESFEQARALGYVP